jgi:hypothetical protein
MSKISVNVPSVEVLKEYLEEYSLKELINRFSCYEYLIGDEEAINFLRVKYKEYKKEKCTKKKK